MKDYINETFFFQIKKLIQGYNMEKKQFSSEGVL